MVYEVQGGEDNANPLGEHSGFNTRQLEWLTTNQAPVRGPCMVSVVWSGSATADECDFADTGGTNRAS